MKRTVVVLLSAVALLLVGAKTADKPLPPLSIQVEVAPSWKDRLQLLQRKTPYTYTCRATVMKPTKERGRIYAYHGLKLVVAPGTRKSITKKGEPFDVTFTVAVSKTLDRARTEVFITRGEEILHVQNSDVLLKAPDRTVVP